jgi:cytochrome c5
MNPLSHMRAAVRWILLFLLASPHVLAADAPEPADEAAALFRSACLQCHGLQVIETRRDGRPGWEHVVHSMVIRGTQLDAREAQIVTDYLFRNYGPSFRAMVTGPLPPDSSWTHPGQAQSSEQIELPAGPGAEQVQALCQMCHDLGRVVSVRRSKDEWLRYTTRMLERADVPFTPETARIIADYLATHFGYERKAP